MLAHLSPDTAVLMFLLGILLVYLEFNVPGKVVPGAAGAFLVMVAVFALMHVAVSGWAVLATAVGIGFVLLELRFPARGLLALAGAGVMSFGLLRLVAAPNGGPRVHIFTAIFVSAVFAAVTVWLGRIALQARRNKAIQPRAAVGGSAYSNARAVPRRHPAE